MIQVVTTEAGRRRVRERSTSRSLQRGAAAVAAVAVAVALAGCNSSGSKSGSSGAGSTATNTSSSGGSSGVSGTITVFAAASLTEAFTTLGKQFEAAHPGTTVKFNFGGSSTLAEQINQGAPADVFASAAPKNMQQVTTTGGANQPTNFASNSLEIAVPPSNPAHITQLSDLAKSGVKVALCDPAVPCGAVAVTVFGKAKLTVKPVTLEQDVKSTLSKVELNEVDAGLVYVSDVKSAGTKVTGIEIPSDVNARTEYPIATLKHAPNAAGAQAFLAYVLSSAGTAALSADGFQGP